MSAVYSPKIDILMYHDITLSFTDMDWLKLCFAAAEQALTPMQYGEFRRALAGASVCRPRTVEAYHGDE